MSVVELEPVFISQLPCTCPKTAIKTPEQCVKCVTSSSVLIVDFDIFHALLLLEREELYALNQISLSIT